jgi:hypothetical protein
MPSTAIARTAGAPPAPRSSLAGIARDNFRLTGGEDDLMIYGEATGHNAHCRRCGSLLYSLVRNGAFVHVAMGTLVDDPTIRPTAHIFVGSKAPWHAITDDLPNIRGTSSRIDRACRRNYAHFGVVT